MRINYFSKAAAVSLMLAMFVASFSCSEKNSSSQQIEQESTAVVIRESTESTHSYMAADIAVSESVQKISGIFSLGKSGRVFVTGETFEGIPAFFTADSDFGMFRSVDAKLDFSLTPDAEDTSIIVPLDDGSFYCVRSLAEHESTIPAADENFDYDAYMKSAEYVYSISYYNTAGELVSENIIDGIDKYIDEKSSFRSINSAVYAGNDMLIITAGEITDKCIFIASDGTVKGVLEAGDSCSFGETVIDKNGRIICRVSNSDMTLLKEIDVSSMDFGEYSVELSQGLNGSLLSGAEDYILFVRMNSGIFGIREDNTVEELVDWVDSGISSQSIIDVIGLENGDFAAVQMESGTGETSLVRLTERDNSELESVIDISVGVFEDIDELSGMVTDFNAGSTKYRVNIMDYSLGTQGSNELEIRRNALDELKMDIISGEAPDVICTYDNTVLNMLSMKGAFADLYGFMENDSEITRDKFLPNILTACETDGSLYSLSPSFAISTLAAKSKFTDLEGCTLDEFIELKENLPEGMDLFKCTNNKWSAFTTSMNDISDYIDYRTGICSFDSPEFINLLEFCNSFPDVENDSSMNDTFQEEAWRCRNDEALVDKLFIGSFRDFNREKNGNFGEDITLVGYPSEDGQGAKITLSYSLAIIANSEYGEGAWEFVKMFLVPEYQENLSDLMPVIDSSFERAADKCMENLYYIDENLGGIKVEYEDTYSMFNMGRPDKIPVGNITQEDRDYLSSYIRGITEISGSAYDSTVYDIYIEELDAYFTGEQSAEDTAAMIQNRVSIFLSEQS